MTTDGNIHFSFHVSLCCIRMLRLMLTFLLRSEEKRSISLTSPATMIFSPINFHHPHCNEYQYVKRAQVEEGKSIIADSADDSLSNILNEVKVQTVIGNHHQYRRYCHGCRDFYFFSLVLLRCSIFFNTFLPAEYFRFEKSNCSRSPSFRSRSIEVLSFYSLNISHGFRTIFRHFG